MKKISIRQPRQPRQPRQIKQEELIKIRKFFHKKQNGICPILKLRFNVSKMCVDHAHTANSNNLGRPEEAGLIRGVIHRQANTMEGKITNSFIRCGLHKFDITMPDFLRHLADFIEKPTMTHLGYIHPNEVPKGKYLGKTCMNRLVKAYNHKYPGRNIPDVMIYKKWKKGKKKGKEKGKKLTAGLERLFEEFSIEPSFLKG